MVLLLCIVVSSLNFTPSFAQNNQIDYRSFLPVAQADNNLDSTNYHISAATALVDGRGPLYVPNFQQFQGVLQEGYTYWVEQEGGAVWPAVFFRDVTGVGIFLVNYQSYLVFFNALVQHVRRQHQRNPQTACPAFVARVGGIPFMYATLQQIEMILALRIANLLQRSRQLRHHRSHDSLEKLESLEARELKSRFPGRSFECLWRLRSILRPYKPKPIRRKSNNGLTSP
jgi:hypothetical protein